MKRIVLIALVLCCVNSVSAFSEYSTDDLLKMTIESLGVDRERDIAFASGVGKITQDGSVGVYLARRSAIADARRGLLILKRALEENKPPRTDSVSGHVPGLRVRSEKIMEGLYIVDAEVSLSELLGRRIDDDPKEYDVDDDEGAEDYDEMYVQLISERSNRF